MVPVYEFEGNLTRHVESKVVEVQIKAHFLAAKKKNQEYNPAWNADSATRCHKNFFPNIVASVNARKPRKS